MNKMRRPYDRDYWREYLDNCIDTIKNDMEKLLDIITDKCTEMTISFFVRVGEFPSYTVSYGKLGDEVRFAKQLKEGDKE